MAVVRERKGGDEISERCTEGEERKGENAYVKFVVLAAESVEEEMSVDLAYRKKVDQFALCHRSEPV